jgi:hypothetical protein
MKNTTSDKVSSSGAIGCKLLNRVGRSQGLNVVSEAYMALGVWRQCPGS